MTARSVKLAIGGIGTAIGRFGAWWWGELRAVAADLRARSDSSRIECRVVGDAIGLRIVHGRGAPLEAVFEPKEHLIRPPGVATILAREARALKVEFHVPPELVLTRKAVVPRSAVNTFDHVVTAELDRWTPFSIAEVLVSWRKVRDIDARQAEVELRLVAKQAIATWLDALRSVGLTASRVVLGNAPPIRVELGAASPFPKGRWIRGAALGFAVSLVALVVLDWMAALRGRSAWRDRVEVERQLLVKQRGLEDRIQTIVATWTGDNAQPASSQGAFLRALSAKLPGYDWLTELSVRDGTVTLRGYTRNVEVLLKALEPLALDDAVSIQGELSVDQRVDRQRFAISFRQRGSGR